MFDRGDIVAVEFPFSDGSDNKFQPAMAKLLKGKLSALRPEGLKLVLETVVRIIS